jgi:hypothetical protein
LVDSRPRNQTLVLFLNQRDLGSQLQVHDLMTEGALTQ